MYIYQGITLGNNSPNNWNESRSQNGIKIELIIKMKESMEKE